MKSHQSECTHYPDLSRGIFEFLTVHYSGGQGGLYPWTSLYQLCLCGHPAWTPTCGRRLRLWRATQSVLLGDVILTRGSAAGGRAGSTSDGTIRSCTDFDSVQFAVSSAIIFTARIYYAKQGL